TRVPDDDRGAASKGMIPLLEDDDPQVRSAAETCIGQFGNGARAALPARLGRLPTPIGDAAAVQSLHASLWYFDLDAGDALHVPWPLWFEDTQPKPFSREEDVALLVALRSSGGDAS